MQTTRSDLPYLGSEKNLGLGVLPYSDSGPSTYSFPGTGWTTSSRSGTIAGESDGEEFVKHDGDKPPLHLIPKSYLDEVAKVLGHGAKKYGATNWRKGTDWSRYYSAAMRHIAAWFHEGTLDEESGMHHLAHAACCLAFLIEMEKKGFGSDDRPIPPSDGLD